MYILIYEPPSWHHIYSAYESAGYLHIENGSAPAIRLGLGQSKNKRKGLPSQSGQSRTGKYWDGAWAEAHTSRRHPLYGQGRRAMEGLHGPQTQWLEGTCAIKVSMRKPRRCGVVYISKVAVHGPCGICLVQCVAKILGSFWAFHSLGGLRPKSIRCKLDFY